MIELQDRSVCFKLIHGPSAKAGVTSVSPILRPLSYARECILDYYIHLPLLFYVQHETQDTDIGEVA